MVNRRRRKLLTIVIISCVAILGLYSFKNAMRIPLALKLRRDPKLDPKTNNSNSLLPELHDGAESVHRSSNDSTPYKGVVYYKGAGDAKNVALTFDDGPDNIFTPRILNILKQNNIKATFFIVGIRAQANPQMVKRILDEGHSIGNHSWDHPDLDKLPSDKVISEIRKTDDLLSSIIGYHTSILRPPYGAANRKVVQEIASMGYNIIDWSVDTRDWAGTPTNTIMNYVKRELRPGAIILQHCSGGKKESLSNTIAALPEIIQYLKTGGYSFVRIPELLNIPAEL